MQVGLTGSFEIIVSEADTASALGSGFLPVLGTPRLIAMMEQAACRAIENSLDLGQTTVGTKIEMEHTAATPVGMRAVAQAKLTAAEKRKLVFEITAFDDAGAIGRAHHERFIVDAERFKQKAQAKLTP